MPCLLQPHHRFRCGRAGCLSVCLNVLVRVARERSRAVWMTRKRLRPGAQRDRLSPLLAGGPQAAERRQDHPLHRATVTGGTMEQYRGFGHPGAMPRRSVNPAFGRVSHRTFGPVAPCRPRAVPRARRRPAHRARRDRGADRPARRTSSRASWARRTTSPWTARWSTAARRRRRSSARSSSPPATTSSSSARAPTVAIQQRFTVRAGQSVDVVAHKRADSTMSPVLTAFRNDTTPVGPGKVRLTVAAHRGGPAGGHPRRRRRAVPQRRQRRGADPARAGEDLHGRHRARRHDRRADPRPGGPAAEGGHADPRLRDRQRRLRQHGRRSCTACRSRSAAPRRPASSAPATAARPPSGWWTTGLRSRWRPSSPRSARSCSPRPAAARLVRRNLRLRSSR